MVQRFRCATVMIMYGQESGDYEGEMRHDPDGEWVMLSTYRDETARLRAKIERLTKQVTRLQGYLADDLNDCTFAKGIFLE